MSQPNDSRTSIAFETRCAKLIIDDEHERSIRRSQAELRRRLTSLSTQSPIVNEEEIYAHYNICLKMCSENKISEKNAWNLKLIDYMRTMLISKFQPKETLQVAGVSLEASTKIYGVRVDDVHSNTLKLASNMARTNNVQLKDDEQQNGQEIDASPEQKKHRKDKRKLPNEKRTTIKEIDALIGKIPKIKSNFFCAHTDDTTLVATNLFSSVLIMHYTGYKFMLLSNETFWLRSQQKKSIIKKAYPIKIHSVDNIKLCEAFHDFEIDEWNIEDEHQFNLQSTEESVLLYNEAGVPLPELDGTIPNIFENLDDDEPNNNEEYTTVCKVNTVKCSINSYSKTVGYFGNKRISRLWAGPSHWKFKCISRKHSRFSGKAIGNKRRPVKKHISQPINFLEEGKSVITKKICKRKLISTDQDYIKCTLPEKFLIDTDSNRPLILKPLYICEANTDILKESFRIADICNDESEDTNPEQSFQNELCNMSVHEVMVHSNQRRPLEENLIDLPEMAQNIFIPYASKAKRIDIKKLKRSIWKSLTSIENPNDISKEGTIQRTKFSKVYQELPKYINNKSKDDLSCPLAFVALLHLANENNLQFTNIDSQNDFYIEKKFFFE